MSTHLIIPDQHFTPEHGHERADYLAQLICDVKPDVVINIGDSADLSSLSSYDKGKKSFHGRSYLADIEAHLEGQDRIWSPVFRRKKRLPRRIFCVGNHEDRITRAVELSPELTGTLDLKDLRLDDFYTEVVPYEGRTPGRIIVDGITYAHYLVSGVAGRPVGGEHPASSLIRGTLTSATVGHLHLADWSTRRTADGRRLHGLFAGCYLDYDPAFAGNATGLWWRGVAVKRNVSEGNYDLQMISLDALKAEYGS